MYVTMCLLDCFSDPHQPGAGSIRSCRFNLAGCLCRWRRRNIFLGLLLVTRWRLDRSAGRHFVPHRGLSWTERQWWWRRGDSQDGLRSARPRPAPPGLLQDIALLAPPRALSGRAIGFAHAGRISSSCVDLSRVTSSRLARFEILSPDTHKQCIYYRAVVQNVFRPVLPSVLK